MKAHLSKTQQMAIATRFELKNSFSSGDRFYSRNECAKRYGVSASTAYVVLQVLVSDGLLQPIKGYGYFVV